MGGGAGVTWEVELNSFHVSFTGKGFKVKGKPEIAKFGAHGYMDGMSDVRGNLLKVKSCEIEYTADDVEYWKETRGGKRGDILTCYYYKSNEDKHPSVMTWAGYVRSPVAKIFPLTLEGRYTLEDSYMTVKVFLTVVPANKEDFGYWFDDVFNFSVDQDEIEENEDGEKDTVEEVYQNHFDDVQMNYGA